MVDFLENHKSAATCVIAFASGGDDFRHEIPSFEWKRTLDELPVSYILMRDISERWYQDGVLGIGDRVAVINWLREKLINYPRRVGLGLSSGAYGALLFGQLVPFDEVIAISPLTMLGPEAEKEFGPMWAHRVRLPPHQAGFDIDLKPIYANGPIPRVRAFVSDGDGAELDYKMASLIHASEITLLPGHSHAGLASYMRDKGLVQKMIAGADTFTREDDYVGRGPNAE